MSGTSSPSVCDPLGCTCSPLLCFCLRHARSLTSATRFPPHAATVKRYHEPFSIAVVPGGPKRQPGVMLHARSRAVCTADRTRWDEEVLLRGVSNISVGLARNELEVPFLQWRELHGSVFLRNCVITESSGHQGQRRRQSGRGRGTWFFTPSPSCFPALTANVLAWTPLSLHSVTSTGAPPVPGGTAHSCQVFTSVFPS